MGNWGKVGGLYIGTQAQLEALGTDDDAALAQGARGYATDINAYMTASAVASGSSTWHNATRRSFLHKAVPGFNLYNKTEAIFHETGFGLTVSNDFGGPWYDISSTGWSVSDMAPPPAGTMGVKQVTGDAATFVGSGIRGAIENLPPDCFGGGREFAFAIRWKQSGTTPVVTDADYDLRAGLASQEGGLAESQDGVYWFYSKAVSKWTLKTARGGTRSTFTSAVDWEDTFHTLAFHVNDDATEVTPYVDGVAQTPITTNIQPNDGISPAIQADSLGASTDDLVFEFDDIAWGYTDP